MSAVAHLGVPGGNAFDVAAVRAGGVGVTAAAGGFGAAAGFLAASDDRFRSRSC